LSWTLVV